MLGIHAIIVVKIKKLVIFFSVIKKLRFNAALQNLLFQWGTFKHILKTVKRCKWQNYTFLVENVTQYKWKFINIKRSMGCYSGHRILRSKESEESTCLQTKIRRRIGLIFLKTFYRTAHETFQREATVGRGFDVWGKFA